MDSPGSPTSVGATNGPPGFPGAAASRPPQPPGTAANPPGYQGRIFGPWVLAVRFRAYYGEDLVLGELLVGADPDHGRRYLFRITDVAYGSGRAGEGRGGG